MNYLLDTCVVSELIKKSPDPGVIRWISETEEGDLHISVIVLGELEKGITKLGDESRKSELRVWLGNLEKRFEGRILDINREISLLWGKITGESERNGVKIPSIDALISATALNYSMTLVTRNVKDMERSGVRILNPWGC